MLCVCPNCKKVCSINKTQVIDDTYKIEYYRCDNVSCDIFNFNVIRGKASVKENIPFPINLEYKVG